MTLPRRFTRGWHRAKVERVDPAYAEVQAAARDLTAANTVVALVRAAADDLGIDPNEALTVIDWTDLPFGPRGEVAPGEVMRRLHVFADTQP